MQMGKGLNCRIWVWAMGAARGPVFIHVCPDRLQ
jgi:hypothetical protein